ncbi:MAG: hypothetical protein BMS9Abin36_0163 [Gammaproteobacteria bacterium]|nr:MAG: hypothetical protein BMS9Abin36_0163 [Gammaproteobacteria bacterium]
MVKKLVYIVTTMMLATPAAWAASSQQDETPATTDPLHKPAGDTQPLRGITTDLDKQENINAAVSQQNKPALLSKLKITGI